MYPSAVLLCVNGILYLPLKWRSRKTKGFHDHLASKYARHLTSRSYRTSKFPVFFYLSRNYLKGLP